MKRFLLLTGFLLLSLAAFAEPPSAYPYAVPCQNDTTTGTTANTLTTLTSAGRCIIVTAGATNGYLGICVASCGTGGDAWIVTMGKAPLLMETSPTPTAQHYVLLPASTNGYGRDSNGTTFPSGSAGSIAGIIISYASGINTAMVWVFPPETQGAGSALPAISTCHYFAPSSGSTLSDQVTTATSFATTLSIPTTCIGTGSLLVIRAHGVYTTTGTAAPKIGFSVSAGGTSGICPTTPAATLVLSKTNGYWDLVCYVQIQVTGTSGTAAVWGAALWSDTTGTVGNTNTSPFVSANNPPNSAYNTTVSENISINETATLVTGQTFNLQGLDVLIYK